MRIKFLLLVFASSLLFPMATTQAAVPGQLIKLACPSKPEVNHPCKAVYYYGGDGKRHAFPNEKVYFTWYPGFSGIQTLTSSAMAAIQLGSNVTYRPGVKMVKFVTVNKVYAVALGGTLRWIATEDAAVGLYGGNWNQQVDDIDDAFFGDYVYGPDIAQSSDFDKNGELTAATSPEANLESSYVFKRVSTEKGAFDINLVTLQRARFSMITDTGDTTDCGNNCTAKPLADYAAENGATIGIHGTYFCPPDYADCASKINTFLSPVYNSAADLMINEKSLDVHKGPMMAQAADGKYFFFHRTRDFGNSVGVFESRNNVQLGGALSNYPSLIEGGTVIVESEERLEEAQRTVKATRGGIGYDDHFVYLVIARSSTVVDLAYIMKALGAKNALNIDGGGSVALLYDNDYKVGPGRLLPNAILFKKP